MATSKPTTKRSPRKPASKGTAKRAPTSTKRKPQQRKRPSGAQNRKAARKRAAQLAAALPATGPLSKLPPPPDDDLLLVLWGARAAAVGVHQVLVAPHSMSPEQWRYFNDGLKTLGMLFPRSELLARVKRLRAAHEAKEEAREVQPLGNLPPGPASRRPRRAPAAASL